VHCGAANVREFFSADCSSLPGFHTWEGLGIYPRKNKRRNSNDLLFSSHLQKYRRLRMSLRSWEVCAGDCVCYGDLKKKGANSHDYHFIRLSRRFRACPWAFLLVALSGNLNLFFRYHASSS
jgi:hypothetical protein